MSRLFLSKMNACAAAVIILVTAAVSRASDPAQREVDANPAKPAPNQSVSIEPVVDGPSAATDNAAETNVAGPRARRRPAVVDLAENDRSTPWYRTGVGALVVVLALVGAAFWCVRRWVPSSRPADAGVMTIVGRTAITPKHGLALVRLGRRYVMVGVSPDRLATLCEISDAEEIADLAARIGLPQSPAASFDALLANEASDYQDLPSLMPDSAAAEPGAAPSSLKSLLGRLRTAQPR